MKPDHIDELIEQLGEPFSTHAAAALASIGTPAVEPLCKVLKDPRSKVRWCSAEVLGNIGDSRAVAPLVVEMRAQVACWPSSALEALVKIGPPAVESLCLALHDNDARIRSRAAAALGRIGPPAVEPLCQAVSDPNVHVRCLAVQTLGEIGDDRAVESLRFALSDHSVDVRERAARALVKIGA